MATGTRKRTERFEGAGPEPQVLSDKFSTPVEAAAEEAYARLTGDDDAPPAPTLGQTMSLLRKEIPRIFRRRTADTGKYKYQYANLEDIYRVIDPVCAKYGVRYSHPLKVEGGQQWVGTRVELLATGEYEECWVLCPPGLQPQDMGKAITYFRRYSLEAAFAIIATRDDDYSPARREAREQAAPAPARPQARQGAQPPQRRDVADAGDGTPGDFREWLNAARKPLGMAKSSELVNWLFEKTAGLSEGLVPSPAELPDVAERFEALAYLWRTSPKWGAWAVGVCLPKKGGA